VSALRCEVDKIWWFVRGKFVRGTSESAATIRRRAGDFSLNAAPRTREPNAAL